MTAVVIYYDSLNGLGALRMDVSEGTNVYAAFHAEAKHRQIPGPSFLGWERMDQLRTAREGLAFKSKQDLVAWRVSELTQSNLPGAKPVTIGVDPECVMATRDANGDLYDAVRIVFEGADYRRKTEKLQELVAGIRPTETPYFMAARRMGKSEFARAYAKTIEGAWNDARVDIEPPNNTPPGLLCVSPMDGRLGNRWSPQ